MNLSNHGSRNQESLFLIDGHNTSQMESVGGANNVFRISASYVAEMNVTTGGVQRSFLSAARLPMSSPKKAGTPSAAASTPITPLRDCRRITSRPN